MSDESTIVATTLLSSLFGATAVAPPQSDNALTFLGDLSQSEGSTDSFSALYSSNLDALQESDTFITPSVQTAAGDQYPSASITSDFMNPVAPLFSELAGKLASLSGDDLPSEDPAEALALTGLSELEETEGSTDMLLPVNEITVTDTVQKNQTTQNLLNQQAATIENSGEFYEGSADGYLSDMREPASQDATSQFSAASSPMGVAAAPHTGQAKPTEGSSQQLNGGVQASTLDAASTNDMDTGSDFQQQGQQQGRSEALELEVRPRQPANAEFANSLQGQQASFQADGIPPTTADLGSNLPSALNTAQSSVPAPLTAQTSLSLAADRAVAGQQIAQQVATFVRQGSDSAQINLSPPHLGRISVSINLQNEQASVVLSAPTAEIRDLLEASLPKLSELLEEAGLELGNADVSSQEQQLGGQDNRDELERPATQANQGDVVSSELAQSLPSTPVGANLLDAYA